jgi:hypothetical protein
LQIVSHKGVAILKTKEKDRFEPISLLEEWISLRMNSGMDSATNTATDSLMGSTIDNEVLSYASLLVAGSMINNDYESLTELKNRLTPMAAKITRRLNSLNIPVADLQASAIPAMSSLVHGAFQYLEWNDPVSTLKRIKYGEDVLAILINNNFKNNLTKKDFIELNLPFIEKTLTEKKLKLSQATISRCIKLLEQKAFIHLTGSTRSRKCHILQKAWQWYETVKADESRKAESPDREAGTGQAKGADIPSYLVEIASSNTNDKTSDSENALHVKRVPVDSEFNLDKYKKAA